jgi:hypothetical protein
MRSRNRVEPALSATSAADVPTGVMSKILAQGWRYSVRDISTDRFPNLAMPSGVHGCECKTLISAIPQLHAELSRIRTER